MTEADDTAMQIINTEDGGQKTPELVLNFLREIPTTGVRMRAIDDVAKATAIAILSIISGGTDSDPVNDEIMEALAKRDDVKKVLKQ